MIIQWGFSLRITGFADYRKPAGRALSRFAIIYGPLASRRRGYSLGINLFPGPSICSFDCIYCFRGGAQLHVPEAVISDTRIGPDDVLHALREALRSLGEEKKRIRAIDFSGNGEPTLHPMFPEIAKRVRNLVDQETPWASLGLFTNSTSLCSPRVIEALHYIDHVEAKLDAAVEWKMRLINRPATGIEPANIIDCLSAIRGRFHGELALQVILIEADGVSNYECSDAWRLASIAERIQPDIINLYTSYAPPKKPSVKKADKRVMERYATILRENGLKVSIYPK